MWGKKRKGKRILAMFLGVCMILQLSGWDLFSFQLLAEAKTLKKEITVSEKAIAAALKGENILEIDADKLPYSEAQKSIVLDNLEALLPPDQMVIVRQQLLGDKCAAIVAVEADMEDQAPETEKELDYDRILLIGLNGNANKDCEFTLKITDADDLVVETLEITGYRPDSEVATASDAERDATGSNALREEPESASDASLEDEDQTYLYVKDYSETLAEEELAGLVLPKSRMAHRSRAIDESGNAAQSPRMAVAPGGYGVASAGKAAFGAQAGAVAAISLSADGKGMDSSQAEVQSGAQAGVWVTATYNAIDGAENLAAYFTVKFDMDAPDLIIGPEAESAPENPEKIAAMEQTLGEIKEKLSSSDDAIYQASAGEAAEWNMAVTETFEYFYCKTTMLAVFKLDGGDGVSMKPIRFTYKNGLAPNGMTLTAEPGVLNQAELENSYTGGDKSGAVKCGEPVSVVCRSDFSWNPVRASQSSESLGNLITGNSAVRELGYTITATPNYGGDAGLGVLYTKAYTVYDEIQFENFYIDAVGCGRGLSEGGGLREFSFNQSGRNVTFLKLEIPESTEFSTVDGVSVTLTEAEEGKITGAKIQYTVKNASLSGLSPADLAFRGYNNTADAGVKVAIGGLQTAGMLKFTGTPRVTNTVDFDAYSIMYEGTDYPPTHDSETVSGGLHHHSRRQLSVTTSEGYPLTKTAYRDVDLSEEAVGDKQFFSPGESVYYKITAQNQSHTEQVFKVTDIVPAGLEFSSVELIGLKVGGREAAQSVWPVSQRKAEDNTVSWDGITIPGGASAELVLAARIKMKEDLTGEGAGTDLINTAAWSLSGQSAELSNRAFAKIYVTQDEIAGDQLEFKKTLISDGGNPPVVGSEVNYTMSVKLTSDSPVNKQWVTMRDEWPEKLSLEYVVNLPDGSLVVLKDKMDREIARFEGAGSAKVPYNFHRPDGSVMTAYDKSMVAFVDVSLFADRGGTEIILSGSVKDGGVIRNHGYIAGGVVNPPGCWAEDIVALAAKIEKNAYYIPAEKADAIQEGDCTENPVVKGTRFAAGDVICYEISVANMGSAGQENIAPVITDNLNKIFGETETLEFPTADFNGKVGSAFYLDESGKWTASNIPEDGIFSLDPRGNELSPGERIVIRLFVKVPAAAAKRSPETYTNTAVAELSIGKNKYQMSASADITALAADTPAGSINTEVLAVGNRLVSMSNNFRLEGAKWTDSWLGTGQSGYMPELTQFPVGQNDYILYRVEMNNSSSSPLKVYEIESWLPKGVDFRYLYTFAPEPNGASAIKGKDNYLTLGGDRNLISLTRGEANSQAWLYYEDVNAANMNTAGAGKDGIVSNRWEHMVIDSAKEGNFVRARMYAKEDGAGAIIPESDDVVTIKPHGTLSFGILAQVTGAYRPGDSIEGKAGFLVDSSVEGDGEAMSGLESMDNSFRVGDKTYEYESHKVLTDTAAAEVCGYTPGIEKKLESYRTSSGDWVTYDPETVSELFAPTDWMRWQVSLRNGLIDESEEPVITYSTAGPIEKYTIVDTLPRGLEYNPEDLDGNVMINAAGETVRLPKPKVYPGESGSVLEWTVEKVDGGYQITGADTKKTALNLSILEQSAEVVNWPAPPEPRTVTVQIGTKAKNNVAPYGTYVNRADLVLGSEYPHEKHCSGERGTISGSDSIYDVAVVDILGSAKTSAYKEVKGTAFDGNPQYANGKGLSADGKKKALNYIQAETGGKVTYSLNVENQSSKVMKNLVIIDRLPEPEDTGLINNSRRGSGLDLAFDGEPKLTVRLSDKSTLLQAGKDYQVRYARWSDLGSTGGEALGGEQWTPSYAGGEWTSNPEGMDCVRIDIVSAEVMQRFKEKVKVIVSYEVQLPGVEAVSRAESAVAWNNFGYSYQLNDSQAGGNPTTISVEASKVGVKIPSAKLSVSKIVDSTSVDDQMDAFTFVLEKKSGDAWVAAGGMKYALDQETLYTSAVEGEKGQFTLKHNQTAVINVPANREYRVRELNAEGYVVSTTGFIETPSGDFLEYREEAPPATQTTEGRTYYCVFKNTKSTMVLPRTGGTGTDGFHLAGALLMISALMAMAGLWLIGRREARKRERLRR